MMMVIRDTSDFLVAPTEIPQCWTCQFRQDTGKAIENPRPVLKFGC